MPQNISNPKGKLMLGYLEDGSDNEHLQVGELFLLCWPCHFSHTNHCSIKNIPWLKALISRAVSYPSSALKLMLILLSSTSLFVSPTLFHYWITPLIVF